MRFAALGTGSSRARPGTARRSQRTSSTAPSIRVGAKQASAISTVLPRTRQV